MSKLACFVPLTVFPDDAKELGLKCPNRVRELLRAHWGQLHSCGYNYVPWYLLERGYMEIEPVHHATDLPAGMDGPYWTRDGRRAFTGVIKFTLWSEEEWWDLEYWMHTGWREGTASYETVLWQFDTGHAMLKKVYPRPASQPSRHPASTQPAPSQHRASTQPQPSHRPATARPSLRHNLAATQPTPATLN